MAFKVLNVAMVAIFHLYMKHYPLSDSLAMASIRIKRRSSESTFLEDINKAMSSQTDTLSFPQVTHITTQLCVMFYKISNVKLDSVITFDISSIDQFTIHSYIKTSNKK